MIIKKLKSNKFLRWLFHKGPSFFIVDKVKIKDVKIGEFSSGDLIINKWTDKYSLKIGKFCSIGENTRILVDGNHRTDYISAYPFECISEKDIPKNFDYLIGKGNMEIGNDVWTGMNVLILPGVNVGDGAIIGAGSIVIKNVEDYEIVGGNPAKHIRYRFNPDQIKSLKKIAWWNWDWEKIKKEIPLLQSKNIDQFIKKHRII